MQLLASQGKTTANSFVENFSDEELAASLYDWDLWGRREQQAPLGSWFIWAIIAGRGFGKTRSGAEELRRQQSLGKKQLAMVGPTTGDIRDLMIEGPAGILNISPPWNMPIYKPSLRRVEWPNGAVAHTYTAEEPDRIRGANLEFAWCEEMASWKYDEESWDMLMLALRHGTDPQCLVTTTPKPRPLIRSLIKESKAKDSDVIITSGSTYENKSNLAKKFLTRVRQRYEGTKLGRQELYAELLDETEGALWNVHLIERTRRRVMGNEAWDELMGQMIRIVVGVDPAVTSTSESSETGIVVCGIDRKHNGYVLEDCSLRAAPHEWAAAVVKAYHDYQADLIIGEVNNGGDLVEGIVKSIDPRVNYRAVRASRGKLIRAEPVAALWEQDRAHCAGEGLELLEDQMCSYVPGNPSPDRMDAMVWAMTELLVNDTHIDLVSPHSEFKAAMFTG
jgi:phage terminase large subunit-like protein